MPERLREEAQRQVAAGIRPAIHAYVERGGSVVADVRAGPIDESSLFYTFSAVKAVLSAAVVQLADRGLLDLDAPIAAVIPEFAEAGKGAITVRQLLTHRAGLRDGPGEGPLTGAAWYYLRPYADQIADICADDPQWEPGTAHGYHGLTLQPLASELVARVTGQRAPDYVRERVFEPMGIADFHLGLPPELDPRRVPMVDLTGRYPTPLVYNLEAMRRWPCGGFTNAAAFGRFFRGLLDAVLGRASPLLSTDAARMMTAIHVAGYDDRRLRSDVPWGLGVSIRPAWPSQPTGFGADSMFGTLGRPGAFGHAGNLFGSMAFADPSRDTVCVVMTNGLLDLRNASSSMRALIDAALADADEAAGR